MAASSTRPRSTVYWNRDLATATRRVYGYEPYCACGWTGKVWRTHRESQLERSFHVCESPFSGEPGTSNAAGGSWGASGGSEPGR